MTKILGKSVPCLVSKPTVGGTSYFWQPSAALARNGWKSIPLGRDLVRAIATAEAENARVAEWRNGGAQPKAVKKFIQRATVAALIDGYKRSEKFLKLATTTQETYTTALNLIEAWATDRRPGDMAATVITPQRVKVLRNALMRPVALVDNLAAKKCAGHIGSAAAPEICQLCEQPIRIQHHRAHNTLRVGRTLFAWGIQNVDGLTVNPFVKFDLEAPPPRDQVWDFQDFAAFEAAAARIGDDQISFTVELAEYIGQREDDMLKLQTSQYREVKELDPEMRRVIQAEDARVLGIVNGPVMGIFIRQGKTKRWIGVPVCGEIRQKVERAIEKNAKRAVPTTNIIVSGRTGCPYISRYQFNDDFNRVKDRAINPTKEDLAAGVVPHPALEDLHFLDLRRTCVVRLGELGLEDGLIVSITGHKLGSIKRILEVYMPRTTKMAARAIVARISDRRDAVTREKVG